MLSGVPAAVDGAPVSVAPGGGVQAEVTSRSRSLPIFNLMVGALLVVGCLLVVVPCWYELLVPMAAEDRVWVVLWGSCRSF